MNFFHTHVSPEAKEYALKCLESGYLSEGDLVTKFEKEIERVFEYKNNVAVNSGTSALHLALRLANVHDGDEVILPAQTFVATGLAVLYCGATPVFADIDKDTGNLSVDDTESKITDKTKAILCVSWGGNPCDLYNLSKLAKTYDLFLIQDNAQALGATYDGFPISGFGDYSCFSFQAIKSLTTGDGGLVSCSDRMDFHLARKLRWFGIDRDHDLTDETGERAYDLHELGYKYHMNNLSAAIGLGNLKGIKGRLNWVKAIADYYDDKLRPYWNLVERNAGSSNSLYTILVDKRKDFMRMMKSKNIPVSVVHVGIDRNRIFGGYQDLSNQRYWDEHHVCLPCHPGLEWDDVRKVVDAVNGGW